jgi:hypothetical protein
MFVDPLTFTHNAVAQTLPRVSTNGTSSLYKKADGLMEVAISHTTSKSRTRSVLRLNLEKVAPDPLQPATNVPYTMSCYVVLDRPLFGFSAAELGQVVATVASIVSNAGYQAKFVGEEH